MQATLDAEFGKDSSEEEEEGEGLSAGCASSVQAKGREAPPPDDTLFCPACNKLFKSSKA